MAILPSRLLLTTVDSSSPSATWDVDDGTGDIWIGFPYRWEVTFLVTPQFHGSHQTQSPLQYDGLDVEVGDWFADFATGSAVKIISISAQDNDSVTAIVEDVDRFNVFSDPSQTGIGFNAAAGAIFRLGEDGLPILAPMSSVYTSLSANLAWQGDLVARFMYRNYVRNNYRVEQVGHTFEVGDIIFSNGATYAQATASSDVMRIVGQVNSVGTPGPDWFTYRPTGRVVDNLSPALPGSQGDLIYIAANGSLTTTKPARYARPIFIQLEVASRGLYLDRNIETVDGAIGYSSQIYIVANVTERNALTNVNPGDQAFVVNMGNGEWAHFVFNMDDEWVEMVTQDASNTDAETEKLDLTYSSPSSGVIATVSSGSRVTAVTVDVQTVFDGTVTLTVGTDANQSLLMGNGENDLTATGIYSTTPSHIFDSGVDTEIKYFLDVVGGTQGAIRVSISYV